MYHICESQLRQTFTTAEMLLRCRTWFLNIWYMYNVDLCVTDNILETFKKR